jgi:hypothetical protein
VRGKTARHVFDPNVGASYASAGTNEHDGMNL